MKRDNSIYSIAELPVLQNTTYCSAEEARSCPTGQVELRRDPHTGAEPSVPADFLGSLHRSIAVDGPRRPVAVWGGSSKGVSFSIIRERLGHGVNHVIDMNRAKQGRHRPVTGLRVISPAEALRSLPEGTHTWVVNSNYLAAIVEVAGSHLRLLTIDDPQAIRAIGSTDFKGSA